MNSSQENRPTSAPGSPDELLAKATRQYEEYIALADLADLAKVLTSEQEPVITVSSSTIKLFP
jgi:hypothetical protein